MVRRPGRICPVAGVVMACFCLLLSVASRSGPPSPSPSQTNIKPGWRRANPLSAFLSDYRLARSVASIKEPSRLTTDPEFPSPCDCLLRLQHQHRAHLSPSTQVRTQNHFFHGQLCQYNVGLYMNGLTGTQPRAQAWPGRHHLENRSLAVSVRVCAWSWHR